MCPAALADLVRRLDVEALAGTKLLYQLLSKLGVTSIRRSGGIHLAKSLTGSTNHEIVESYALASTPQGVERLTDGRRFGD